MNERIKELFEQVADNLDPEDCMVSEEFLESFAELIVQECIDIAYREGDNVAYLALHFGVER